MGLGGDTGDHPHQDVDDATRRHRRLQPVDVVGAVHDHEAEAVLDGERDLVGELGVAVQDDEPGVDAGLEGAEDLAAARDVEPQSFLDHHPLDGRAGEGLGREDHPAAWPARGETVGVLARPGAQGVLRHDEHRGPGLGGELVEPTPADQGNAVVGE